VLDANMHLPCQLHFDGFLTQVSHGQCVMCHARFGGVRARARAGLLLCIEGLCVSAVCIGMFVSCVVLLLLALNIHTSTIDLVTCLEHPHIHHCTCYSSFIIIIIIIISSTFCVINQSPLTLVLFCFINIDTSELPQYWSS
jgi:hypothetical protein